MMETKRFKAISLEFKDDQPGHIVIKFSRLNDRDKDNDVTVPGAFGNQRVLLSVYNHGTSIGKGAEALPIGKGEISEIGDIAVFDGDFFLDTQSSIDHYRTLKNTGDLQEYSYSFDVTQKSFGKWKDGVDVRFIEKSKVYEVSPVLVGAGNDTETMAIKNADKSTLIDGAKSKQYKEHAELVLEACADFVKRSQSIADLRTEEGKEAASEKNREGLKAIAAELSKAASDLKRIAETDSEAEEVQTKQKAAELVARFEYLNRSA
jgi:HK97 family phage prohead protease